MTNIFGSSLGKAQSCLKEFTEVTLQRFRGVKIPVHAEMNAIRPKMQLSGGVVAVSLKREKGDLHFRDQYILGLQTCLDSISQLPVIWGYMWVCIS